MSLATGRPSKKAKDELGLADVTSIKKTTVRVNFNLDEAMYRKLKQHALDNRKTVTQLLTEMIDNQISER